MPSSSSSSPGSSSRSEKQAPHPSLPAPTSATTAAKPSSRLGRAFVASALLLLLLAQARSIWAASERTRTERTRQLLAQGACPAQIEPLNVGPHWDVHADGAYAAKAVDRLARAIQIETVSYDAMTTGPVDERFDGLRQFGRFLDDHFPKLNTTLSLELINDLGRLYTWPGTDLSLKPILLMAHQDTVPVPASTVDRWTHPPFAGHVDEDGWIWGRGAADCKNTLLAILGAVERLVEEGFEPERTILLAFGHDEEIGGSRGAAGLAGQLLDRYGPSGLALIVDEGFTGVDAAFGTTIASLGLAEKGAVNLGFEVATVGGHSSVPPEHTAIGLLALVLAELERQPFAAGLDPKSPYLQYLQCAADFGPRMPSTLKRRLKDPARWPALASELAGADPIVGAFLRTTQAIDLVAGGNKVNALPERATATVNYRIDFTSSVAETVGHVVDVVRPLAASLNLTFDYPGASLPPPPPALRSSAAGPGERVDVVRLTVGTPSEMGLEPAPLTATEGAAFELVAGTTRHVFPDCIVAPSAMIANTDTKHFWNLTADIFRFLPAPLAQVKNFHTVDERIKVEGHLTVTGWYYTLLRNTQGWKGPTTTTTPAA